MRVPGNSSSQDHTRWGLPASEDKALLPPAVTAPGRPGREARCPLGVAHPAGQPPPCPDPASVLAAGAPGREPGSAPPPRPQTADSWGAHRVASQLPGDHGTLAGLLSTSQRSMGTGTGRQVAASGAESGHGTDPPPWGPPRVWAGGRAQGREGVQVGLSRVSGCLSNPKDTAENSSSVGDCT